LKIEFDEHNKPFVLDITLLPQGFLGLFAEILKAFLMICVTIFIYTKIIFLIFIFKLIALICTF
jgi:hypothetical protein